MAGMPETTDAPPVITSIHLAPGTRLPLKSVERVVAEAGKGLVGDRYHGTRHRHVSVQSAEELAEAAVTLGAPVPADGTRRNLTLSHGRIPTRPGSRISIGEVELEVVRIAAPCRLLDDNLGPGGAAALRRRAGSICRVLTGGEIVVGAAVRISPLG
jgi:MOSC domain-containing protein YiiM